MNYQRISTACLRYWLIFWKEEIEEWGYNLTPLLPLPFLFPYFFDWMGDCDTFDVILFDNIMDLHMPSLGILVPEEPCCVFYTTRYQIYWGLTYNEVFLLVLWFDIIHTNKDIQHTQSAKRLTHPYEYILTPPAMCSQQLLVFLFE